MSEEILSKEAIIEDIDKNIETLSPGTVSIYSVRLSSHLYHMSEQLAGAKRDYHKQWEKQRMMHDTHSDAQEHAKASVDYYNKVRLEHEWEGLIELINSLKKRLSELSDEGKGLH